MQTSRQRLEQCILACRPIHNNDGSARESVLARSSPLPNMDFHRFGSEIGMIQSFSHFVWLRWLVGEWAHCAFLAAR